MIGLSRVPDRKFGEVIGQACSIIPAPIQARLAHVQFVCGVDPGFAGLHFYGDATDGRSYGETAHCCYPFHLARPAAERVTTVVLPVLPTVATVVHELGHALHETLRFEPDVVATTEYAQRNKWEAFAEFFTTSLFLNYGNEAAFHSDLRGVALLTELAA